MGGSRLQSEPLRTGRFLASLAAIGGGPGDDEPPTPLGTQAGHNERMAGVVDRLAHAV